MASAGEGAIPATHGRCCSTGCDVVEPREKLAPAKKNAQGEVTSWRCKPCNAARGRCAKVLKEHPSIEQIASETTDLAGLAVKCKSLYGEDLIASVRQHYTAKYEVSSEVDWVALKMGGI